MGIYHYMGLGKSVGAVTAAVSYMAACMVKGGPARQRLFGRSGHPGEAIQGAAQAFVIFTTRELARGEELAAPYINNRAGAQVRRADGNEEPAAPVDRVLRRILKRELGPLVARDQNHRVVSPSLYWCEIDRRDPQVTYERVVQVLAAGRAGGGGQGKEIWINLTGGSNLINSALQIGNALSGVGGRQYYLVVDGDNARGVRHTVPETVLGTDADQYWVDVPGLFFSFTGVHAELLQVVSRFDDEGLSDEEAYSLLFETERGVEVAETMRADGVQEAASLNKRYLMPLLGQDLLRRDERGRLHTGGRLPPLQRYLAAVPRPITQAAQFHELIRTKSDWFHASEALEVDAPAG